METEISISSEWNERKMLSESVRQFSLGVITPELSLINTVRYLCGGLANAQDTTSDTAGTT